MSLVAGQRLSFYEVLAPLGAGAMGEVFRARDTRLEREVAIKVLPEAFAADQERLARFEREAKSLAALNHPNIAQIFGIDQVGDTCFLALELVRGETLAERLARGPLAPEEALEICRQIADGLEAAHEAGVIHRDLKPANVLVTPRGQVKLLDFGLAKPRAEGRGSSTDSVLSTEQGRLLGTPTYMAPEQARGKAVDRRVDIWAFGCVLFECLTGKRAFEGESMSDVLAAVLQHEPDLARLPAGTPRHLCQLLARCLAKDPRQRLRDAGDARLLLEGGALDGSAAAARATPAWRRALPWLAALVLGLALVLREFSSPGAGAAPEGVRPPRHLAVRLPHGVHLGVEPNVQEHQVLAVSPDGTRIAFVAERDQVRRLYLRELGALAVRELAATEDASSPFFSPEGNWLGFFARGKLRKLAIEGGAPVELCDAGLNRGGAWGPDGTIVFARDTSSPLVAISSNGGTVRELTALDPGKHERSHRWPVFLPGGREVAFTIGTTDRPGDYEDSAIDAVVLASGERRALLTGASMVRCAGPDVLVLGREGQLFALPFRDGAASSLAGAVPVLQGVAGVPASGVVYFDVASDGTLVYSERNPHDVEFELAWLSRTGEVEQLPLPVREYRMPRLSPDGKRIAVGIGPARGRASDIWIADIGEGALTRLTFDARSAYPAWSPDGKRVAFGTAGSGKDTLSWKAADGSDAAEVLFTFEQSVPRAPDCWTPDGESLIFTQDAGPGRSSDLFLWSRKGGVRELVSTPSLDGGSQLSPDGRWLAYGSDQSGSQEIYVRALHGSPGRWQVSDVGESVRWSPDGRELYYTQGTRMFAVAVQGDAAAGTFTYGTPQLLFEQDFQPTCETQTNFDVGSDGRFLVVRSTSEESMAGHVAVVLDWDMELRAALARR